MSNVKVPDLGRKNMPGGPYGYSTTMTLKATQPASGGVAQNDYFYLAELPAGTEVHSLERIHEAGGANVTMSFGFVPKDSSLGPTANDAYWFSAADVSAIGRAASAAHPVVFDYPVYLVAKNASAAAFAAGKYVGVVVTMTCNGASV